MSKIFGENMKRVRIEHGLSRKSVAESLEVPYSSLSNWESGAREPDLETLVKISKCLGVSINRLLSVELSEDLQYSPENQANHFVNKVYQHYSKIPLKNRNNFEKDLLEYMSFLIFKYKKFIK
ncbi:helix-turn-helix transcriptional regulator [Paenibacillus larvae]